MKVRVLVEIDDGGRGVPLAHYAPNAPLATLFPDDAPGAPLAADDESAAHAAAEYESTVAFASSASGGRARVAAGAHDGTSATGTWRLPKNHPPTCSRRASPSLLVPAAPARLVEAAL